MKIRSKKGPRRVRSMRVRPSRVQLSDQLSIPTKSYAYFMRRMRRYVETGQ